MNDYQQEQFEALTLAKECLEKLSAFELEQLKNEIASYLVFRNEVDQFLSTHFSAFCTQTCYENRRSACCSKDGIVTFWADVVINMLCSTNQQMADLEHALSYPAYEHKCTYLSHNGCCWQVRPLMCAMFLCDQVQVDAFTSQNSMLEQIWIALNEKAKGFRWPDKPVLFDRLETYFLALGAHSSLMYINTSPGLMRIKQQAGLTPNAVDLRDRVNLRS